MRISTPQNGLPVYPNSLLNGVQKHQAQSAQNERLSKEVQTTNEISLKLLLSKLQKNKIY